MFLLLLSACAPSENPDVTVPRPPGSISQNISIASDASRVDLSVQEPDKTNQTPQPILADPLSERAPVSSQTTQSEIDVSTSPDVWKDLPVIPEISPKIVQIYAYGVSKGNNPYTFSKIGDCSTSNAWFLGSFDDGDQYYRLGEHAYLEPMIDHFKGSYGRDNITTRNGFSASSALSPLWADPEVCQSGETPLACEYRIHRPSIVFIMLGTNDRWHSEQFEENMREILEFTLEKQIVPILATKADNFEGDESINNTLAKLANEYDVPLWNFWAALQSISDTGMEADGVHLTWGPNHFDDPEIMKLGWPTRNLTAMQVLHAIWQAVQETSVDEIAVLR